MEKEIFEMSPKDLLAEINKILKGNPRAMRLVYSFLLGYLGSNGKSR